jgi:hypothetical protein
MPKRVSKSAIAGPAIVPSASVALCFKDTSGLRIAASSANAARRIIHSERQWYRTKEHARRTIATEASWSRNVRWPARSDERPGGPVARGRMSSAIAAE